jgi:hypothetical protein
MEKEQPAHQRGLRLGALGDLGTIVKSSVSIDETSNLATLSRRDILETLRFFFKAVCA